MTISHRLADDELAQATIGELYAALGAGDTPSLFARPYRIDVDHDVPNGGGSSLDGRTIYIDRTLYAEARGGAFAATGLSPAQIIARWADHEHAEITIITGDNPVDTYMPAHERALRYEHQGVLAILGSDDGESKIRRYEETIWPALLRCYHRPIAKPPRDLWCGPNHDEPTERDREILAQLTRLGAIDAGKRSKYDVHYGMADHRCLACRHWAPRIAQEGHGKLAICMVVSGMVRDDRGCDKWQAAPEKLPQLHFGAVGRARPDWRSQPDDDPDDEPIATPRDVIQMLGFDPAKEPDRDH